MRDQEVVRQGVAACRATLEDLGVLLVQDAQLPSVTTTVVGTPVRGSWWAHEHAHSIFDVLEALETDATVAKLIARKQTLVHRRRWADLAAVGGERAPWQFDTLAPDAVALVEQVDATRSPIRTDALTVDGARRQAEVVRDVEQRLLLHVEEVHTDSGRHAKELQPWARWIVNRSVATPLPDPGSARAEFEAVVASFAPERVARLLPWPVEDRP